MITVYTFVFSEIFQAKWSSASQNKLEFAIILFCGLTTFNLFSEVISRSPSLILNNTNYVKKVVFPLEILPLVAVGTALVNSLISFVLLLLFKLLITSVISWSVILLPIILLPLLFFTLGLSWFLSSLGVYFRDINYIVGIGIQALMLLSPIFYPANAIPEQYRFLYNLNPITSYVEDTRNLLIWGYFPNLFGFFYHLIFGIFVCLVGYLWFRKTKRGFADIL